MIRTYPDLEALSRAAAELFTRKVREAVEEQRRFSVALSGGGTPRRTYELLAQSVFAESVFWDKVHVFWGDERCVPPDDPRSNERMAREALLDHLPVPQTQIHPIRCHKSPPQAARQYEATLQNFFKGRPPRFDLIFLGLGENGHTASLFPDTPVLDEKNRWVSEVYVTDQEIYRVTLTVPLINQAATVVFLVSGHAKASVLHAVLTGPQNPLSLPAQLIKPESGDLIWLVDEVAGSLISTTI